MLRWVGRSVGGAGDLGWLWCVCEGDDEPPLVATFRPGGLTGLGTDPAGAYQLGLILVGEQSLGLFE